MRYLGGKSRLGKTLAEVIQGYDPRHYHEPFCGMFSVGKHVQCARRTACDIHPDLILFLKAVRDGWEPPTSVSEADYKRLQTAPPSALRGFVGFGCSFYGRFFEGFARDARGTNYAAVAKRSLSELVPFIKGVEFTCAPYSDYTGDADVIYCDPPYRGTTSYSHSFNHDMFWDWVRAQSRVVLVSEYTAPKDFVAVWQRSVTTLMRDKRGTGCERVEKLFKRA